MKISKEIANVRHALLQDKKEHEARLKLSHAIIKDGYVYATDAFIMIKTSVSNFLEWVPFDNGKKSLTHDLDGLVLSFDLLTKMSKSKSIQFINGELLLDDVVTETNKHDNIHYTGWIESSGDNKNMPVPLLDFESVIPKVWGAEFSTVGMDVEAIYRLGKCFLKVNNNRFKFEFTHNSYIADKTKHPQKPIKVTSSFDTDFDEMGIIIPIMVD